MKPNLYALLVGIGAYEQVRALRGPVGDAEAMHRYLQKQTDFVPNLLLLTDQQATKTALIDGFQTHLAQAGPNDTVLFYFAGHGAQEIADTDLWITETDGKLECLVCYDGDTPQVHDFLLADKELRYLIGQVGATGAHVVSIFDCCHSGDNTRAFDLLAAALDGQDVRDRRIPDPAPRRPYEGFFFHQTLPAEQLKAQGVAVAIPETLHVQMAACESDESAVEANAEGIFTKNLLAVLEAAHGQITYSDLHNRVRQYMRFGYEQRPRVYVPETTEGGEVRKELMNRGFLNQAIDPDTLSASATYNQRMGWLLDVGAIHGLATGKTSAIQLHNPANETVFLADLERVGPDYAVLKLTDDVAQALDKTAVYRATIAGLLTQPLRLHFANHGGPNNDLPDLLKPSGNPAQPALTEGLVIPEEDESRAEYTLNVRNGLYYITKPSTPPQDHSVENRSFALSPFRSLNTYRPLIRPALADEPKVFTWLTNDLRHVAKWEYLKNLRNPDVVDPVLTVELMPAGAATIKPTEAQPAAIPITYTNNNGTWSTTLTMRLTNPTEQPVYCTALYLSRDFMAFPGFLPANCRIEPGQTVTLGLADRKAPTGRRTAFSMDLEDVIREYNWPTATEYFKLLVTTDPLSEKTLAFLRLAALPSPPVLADRLKPTDTRGSIKTEPDEAEPLPEWSTQTITMQFINPHYNTVREDQLKQMLTPSSDDDMLAEFALGLYYETDDSGPQPTLKLRDGIRVILPDEGQRGLWTDLTLGVANAVAKRVQNRQYRQNLVRYPDRIRIVAEGDSWFQYPFMLRDIIDYLSGVYSVFSVAAAGATLEDYLKNSEFLETIAQVKPQFFLLSGGGNDLLGEAFATLIRDAPDTGKTGPERYLTDAFQTTLTAVLDRYKRILRLVHLGYPDVRVLVHGYDYVIPSGAEKLPGSSSWMGEVLNKRGITDTAEREGISRHIIDGFNEQLRTVAAQYPNVTYLDLRGTVRRTNRLADYWYDEIHPNDKGFLSLSSKFVSAINSH